MYTNSTHLKTNASKYNFALVQARQTTWAYLGALGAAADTKRTAYGKKPLTQ